MCDDEQKPVCPACPDFVIELRSRTDGLADLHGRMELWIENGVEVGWLVDPKERTVWVYRSGQAVEQFVDPSSVLGDGPVSGFVW